MNRFAHTKQVCGKEPSAGNDSRERSLGGGYKYEQDCFALTKSAYFVLVILSRKTGI